MRYPLLPRYPSLNFFAIIFMGQAAPQCGSVPLRPSVLKPVLRPVAPGGALHPRSQTFDAIPTDVVVALDT